MWANLVFLPSNSLPKNSVKWYHYPVSLKQKSRMQYIQFYGGSTYYLSILTSVLGTTR